jgi:hypothetical protein
MRRRAEDPADGHGLGRCRSVGGGSHDRRSRSRLATHLDHAPGGWPRRRRSRPANLNRRRTGEDGAAPDGWPVEPDARCLAHHSHLEAGARSDRGHEARLRDSVENEWLCARVLAACGLPVAVCEVLCFEDLKVLALERSDCAGWTAPQGDPRLLRPPQEDMGQAKGMPPAAKYEADGGPGIDAIFQVLEGSMAREQDRRAFFQAQVPFWMPSATDGQAKSFSPFIRPGGRHQLTPLCDALSAHPALGEGPSEISPHTARLAMALRAKNARWKKKDVLCRHWLELGTRHGVVTADGGPEQPVLDDLVARTPEVLAQVRAQLPPGFPADVAHSILARVQGPAAQLAAWLDHISPAQLSKGRCGSLRRHGPRQEAPAQSKTPPFRGGAYSVLSYCCC